MKKRLVILMALSLLAVAVPILAEEGQHHGVAHQSQDEQCAKECEMLLRNCAQEVDSIHDRIKNLTAKLKEKGANAATVDELKTLNIKLNEANALLKNLQRPR